MKTNRLYKSVLYIGIFSILIPFFASSCGDEPSISENTSIPSISESPTPITLSTPKLNLNEENGLVSWDKIDYATYYSYYINDNEIDKTFNNYIPLNSGDVISIKAESSLSHIYSSSWSDPIVYFDKSVEEEYVNIYFYDSSLAPVKIIKGSTYIPKNPSKTYHTFTGWYLDPYFKEKLTNDYIFNENTILYPDYYKDEWIKESNYWIKISPGATSNIMSSITSTSGWKYIPLKELSNPYNNIKDIIVYKATVIVSGASATNPVSYLIMDGTIDTTGRTYFKDIDLATGKKVDFNITSDGVYDIYFSASYTWDKGNYKVHSYFELIDSDTNNLYNEKNYHKELLNNYELDAPNIKLDLENEIASWNVIEHASGYEYVIDNNKAIFTTSNNINLYKGSTLTVRSIGEEEYLTSRWSRPAYQNEALKTSNHVYVYFYGLNRPALKIDKGNKISRPTNNPTKPNYIFDDWYNDITYKTKFDFNKIIEENITIYAKFNYDNLTKYSLFKNDLTAKVGDFVISNQYEYNEYKITFVVTNVNDKYYVKGIDNKTYGPYLIGETGTHHMYFSPDHKWDVNTINERNAYWTPDTKTLYFSNNKWWNKVHFYVWDSNGNFEKSYPGNLATFVKKNDYGEDIYKLNIQTKYIGLVINDGGSNKTIDIDLSLYTSGTGIYLTGDYSPFNIKTYQYE